MDAKNATDPEGGLVLAIDIGGTLTKLGLVRRDGRILRAEVMPTRSRVPFKVFCDRITGPILAMRSTAAGERVHAIGVGAPNANGAAGTMVSPPNLDWGDEVPLTASLKAIWELPVFLTNDANAAALGEQRYGVARGMKDFVTLTLGTGLGSGIISHGQLLTGHNQMAGEIGHINVLPGGRQCNCGLRGCLETYASVTGLKRTVFELIAQRTDPTSLKGFSFDELTGAEVSKAAQQGDPIAREAIRYTAEILGLKMADTVAHLDPEAFVIAGGLSQAGDLLLEPLKTSMESHLFPVYRGKVKILLSGHSSEEAVLGPAALAWNALERHPVPTE